MKISCDSQQVKNTINVKHNEITLEVPGNVYQPHEDSTMLADTISRIAFGEVLDMGCGSGLQGITAAKKKEVTHVTCVDFSEHALKTAKENARKNQVEKKIEFIQSNMFEELRTRKFDVIAFNPPYLPTDEMDEGIESYARATWDGGKDGRKLLDPFLEEFDKHLNQNGILLLVQSSLNGPRKTNKILREKGFKVTREAHSKFFFEELMILKAQKM